MKKLLTILFTITACFSVHAQTNSPAPSGLPPAVTQADSKVLQLRNQIRANQIESADLQTTLHDRAMAHLQPTAAQNIKVAQLRVAGQQLAQQLVPAEKWDYQIRESNHLPPLEKSKPLKK
jgi:hypothetical protein